MIDKFGCLKDRPDERDWIIGDYLTKDASELPESIDYSNRLTPVRNQGDEPSCVAFAACAMKEYQEQGGYLSPRYLYQRIKQPQGGAYLRDAMRLLQSDGVPPEDCNPYVPQVPTGECLKAKELAFLNRIKGYARLHTIADMKLSLFENGPFLAAFWVNESWDSPKGGVVVGYGEVTGGHAVLIVGYDNSRGVLKFRNSWYEDWGDRDYGYISYIDAQKSLMDAWSAVDVPEAEEQVSQPEISWLQKIIEWVTNLFR